MASDNKGFTINITGDNNDSNLVLGSASGLIKEDNLLEEGADVDSNAVASNVSEVKAEVANVKLDIANVKSDAANSLSKSENK